MSFTNAQLATKISDLINFWSTFNEQYKNWLGGEVDGGPGSDGKYPLTDYTGDESLVDSPAKLADNVSGYVGLTSASAAAALASENAADTSESNASTSADTATAQAVLADADRVAAELAETNAQDSAVTATAQANLAATRAAAALVSEDASAVSAAAALASEIAAAASAAAAATFDPALFAALADNETFTGNNEFQGTTTLGDLTDRAVTITPAQYMTWDFNAGSVGQIDYLWLDNLYEFRVNRKANQGSNIVIGEPTTLRGDAQDSTLTMWGEHGGTIYGFKMSQYSSNMSWAGTGANPTQSLQANLNIQVLAGKYLQVYDVGNTDYVRQSHDGTDYNFDATNTTDVNFTGQISLNVESKIRVQTSVDILAQIPTANPPTTEGVTAKFNFFDSTAGVVLMEAGFSGSNNFQFINRMHGGEIFFSGENTSGVQKFMFHGNPDGATEIYDRGVLRIQTLSYGLRLMGTAAFYLPELSASQTDLAGYGQLWIKNDAPNTLKFTDDTGVDFSFSFANWDTAYGWGNHASAGYASGSFYAVDNSIVIDRVTASLQLYGQTGTAFVEIHGDVASYIDFSLDGSGGTDKSARLRYYNDYLQIEEADLKVAQTIYQGGVTLDATYASLSGGQLFTGQPQMSYGIGGNYFNNQSTAFGATIWSIDESWQGGAAGANSSQVNVYGLRWVRSTHTNHDPLIGEGLYIITAGVTRSGIGQAGIQTDGTIATTGAAIAGTAGQSHLSADFLFVDGKEAIDGNDQWLRLNQENDFTNGIYTPYLLRVDGPVNIGGTTQIIDNPGSTALRVTTAHGYCEWGPANTSFSHFSTDRAEFYFNKQLAVAAGIRFYLKGKYVYYDDATYVGGKITVASSAPSSPAKGDQWFDTS